MKTGSQSEFTNLVYARKCYKDNGFTLVEISLVLVIIALVIGSILIGQDMINSAKLRNTIAQIESYDTAVNTFKIKYNCLPGDCAGGADFGFLARGPYAGEGDGNGVLEGILSHATGQNRGTAQNQGETAVFWVDLSMAKLINNSFTRAREYIPLVVVINENSSPAIADYIPRAHIGNNYIYVWSKNNINYYGLSSIYNLTGWTASSNPGLSVLQAYSIDTKIDDGLPQSGKLTARYLAYNVIPNALCLIYSQGPGVSGASDTSATPGSATGCYDNNNTAGATQKYSLSQNGGNGINCALSFQFK